MFTMEMLFELGRTVVMLGLVVAFGLAYKDLRQRINAAKSATHREAGQQDSKKGQPRNRHRESV